MDTTGTSLLSPGQAWSTRAYYVDGAESHPTGDEPLLRKIQALPMRNVFEDSNNPEVKVKLLSFDKIDRSVHCMNDGVHGREAAKADEKPGPFSALVAQSKFYYGEIHQERVCGEDDGPHG